MTELFVEEINETVIEIEGGPTLSTTMDETVQTIVQEFLDPVLIDLNSGPRGEPGAAILTGFYPPDTNVGVMGDMYIVTQGTILVGQVFRKTSPATWTDVGNVRGPAGGVNTVNGYTGPDVTLVKADIGLGNADNTSDANKPVSIATQAAITALSDDTVKLTGAQTIAGVKTFTDAPVVPNDSFAITKVNGLQSALNLKANDSAVVHLSGTETITGVKTYSSIFYAAAGAGALTLKPNAGDHVYLQINARTAAPDTRSAWIGYGSAGHTQLTMSNEIVDGAIVLQPNGTGLVYLNGSGVSVQGTLLASGVISGNGSGLTTLNGSNISSGTVADARLSANVALLAGTQTFTGNKTFTGAIVVPVPSADTHASTKKYVDDAIAILTNGSPALLNTLDELAQAIGDDANFSTTIANSLALKAPINNPTFTGTIGGITKAMVGLANVDNTADAAKPVSTAQQTALNLKVGLAGTETITGAKTFSAQITATAGIAVTGTVSATTGFSGSGAAITALDATNISAGTLADARLSTNVALLNAVDQKFTGRKTIEVDVTSADWSARSLLIHNNNSTGSTIIAFQRGLSGAVGMIAFDINDDFMFRNGSNNAWKNIRAGAIYDTGNRVYSESNPPPVPAIATNIVYRVVHTGTTWPARPTGATYVEWVGPTAPTSATANDTWVNTAA